VVTTDQEDNPDYRYLHILFTFPAETSLIYWILLSEIQLCGGTSMWVSVAFQRQHHQLGIAN